MNDAMPQWRTFSSEPPAPGGATPEPADAPTRFGRPRLDLATVSLIGLGCAGLAVALLALISLIGAATPVGGLLADAGEPLGSTGLAGDTSPQTREGAAAPLTSEEMVVDVAGAVVRPGLHRLAPGARVGDAVAAAGGFAARVDLAEVGRSLNLAQPLNDGIKVLVPELGYDQLMPATVDDGRIDLNRADQAALERLPGIGPVTATKIIDARASRRFGSVRELRDRGLVGDSVFEQITGLVRVGS